jgi:hypothetical protein
MIVRPPRVAKAVAWTLLGGFGSVLIGLSVWAILHDQATSGIAGLGLGLLFIVLARGASGVALAADATTIAATSLRGRKTILRAEVARLDMAGGPTNPTLYFLRSDDTIGLTVGTALFRASDLRAFASFLGLDFRTPPWMH